MTRSALGAGDGCSQGRENQPLLQVGPDSLPDPSLGLPVGDSHSRGRYLRTCASALAAALFVAFDVRPSRSAFDAAFAADGDVFFRGAFVCESALPAAFFEPLPVERLRSVDEAFLAAFRPVVLDFPMVITSRGLGV